MLTLIEIKKEMRKELIEFLTSETWPFHGQPNPTEESINNSFQNGFFTESGNQSFWILENEEKIGILRLFDLEDPTCLFDLRINSVYRGRGLGVTVVKYMTDYIFKNYPHIIRIEGHTRNDNYAMRKTFYNSGYVKESYHRKAWPQGERLYDSVGYAMLRSDWENHTKTLIEDSFAY